MLLYSRPVCHALPGFSGVKSTYYTLACIAFVCVCLLVAFADKAEMARERCVGQVINNMPTTNEAIRSAFYACHK